MTSRASALTLLASLFLAGCAAPSPFTPGSSSQPEMLGDPHAHTPRSANRNLSGYPIAFRQGYVEGCDSAGSGNRHRDEGRYKGDLDYLMGWNDGYSVCRR